MNLFARYAALKKKVGGNREKRRFEFTMGRSVAEANRITEPSPSIRRILSETLFALELSTTAASTAKSPQRWTFSSAAWPRRAC